jgi:hypothetical protein
MAIGPALRGRNAIPKKKKTAAEVVPVAGLRIVKQRPYSSSPTRQTPEPDQSRPTNLQKTKVYGAVRVVDSNSWSHS